MRIVTRLAVLATALTLSGGAIAQEGLPAQLAPLMQSPIAQCLVLKMAKLKTGNPAGLMKSSCRMRKKDMRVFAQMLPALGSMQPPGGTMPLGEMPSPFGDTSPGGFPTTPGGF